MTPPPATPISPEARLDTGEASELPVSKQLDLTRVPVEALIAELQRRLAEAEHLRRALNELDAAARVAKQSRTDS
jgi:hypothetical protein